MVHKKYNRMFIKNWFKIIWSKIRLFFGVKYDKSVIPYGLYCYEPDIEKNKNKAKDDYSYYIKPCPYYLQLNKYLNGCMYYGIITDDFVFDDQCKLGDINIDDDC